MMTKEDYRNKIKEVEKEIEQTQSIIDFLTICTIPNTSIKVFNSDGKMLRDLNTSLIQTQIDIARDNLVDYKFDLKYELNLLSDELENTRY